MKKFCLAVSFVLSLALTSWAGPPSLSLSVPYSLPPRDTKIVHLTHNLGYVPQVQVVTYDSSVVAHVYVVTTTDVWLYLRNTIKPPGAFLEANADVYLY